MLPFAQNKVRFIGENAQILKGIWTLCNKYVTFELRNKQREGSDGCKCKQKKQNELYKEKLAALYHFSVAGSSLDVHI